MRFWIRELAGWALVLVGLFFFVRLPGPALAHHEPQGSYLEAGPLTLIGIVVFRGGIHLLKVAMAARVCMYVPIQETTSFPISPFSVRGMLRTLNRRRHSRKLSHGNLDARSQGFAAAVARCAGPCHSPGHAAYLHFHPRRVAGGRFWPKAGRSPASRVLPLVQRPAYAAPAIQSATRRQIWRAAFFGTGAMSRSGRGTFPSCSGAFTLATVENSLVFPPESWSALLLKDLAETGRDSDRTYLQRLDGKAHAGC